MVHTAMMNPPPTVGTASGGTFAKVNVPTMLFAGGVVVASVAVVEAYNPKYGVPYAVVILLGVGLSWKDASGNNAIVQVTSALQRTLSRLQQGTGITPGVPSGVPGTILPSPAPPSNLLPGLNLGSLFGGIRPVITTRFGYGSAPGEHYSFGGLTIHQGVDVIPQGLTSVQAIGHNVYNLLAGRVVSLIQGDPEHRGIVLDIGHGLYEHIYHIDPNRFTPGTEIGAGQLLGTIASMQGAHVHYELRTTPTIGGRSIDPTRYLR